MTGWASKEVPVSSRYVAHFVLEDGTAACSHVLLKDGRLALAPFVAQFGPLRPHDHLCTMCRRLHGGPPCGCGRCTPRPVAFAEGRAP